MAREWQCYWCGVITLKVRARPWTFSRDHLHPKVHGSRVSNETVTACRRCNNTRGAIPWDEWAAWLLTPDGQRFVETSLFMRTMTKRERRLVEASTAKPPQPQRPSRFAAVGELAAQSGDGERDRAAGGEKPDGGEPDE